MSPELAEESWHSDGENARYWADQARKWIDQYVHGKEVEEVVAIAGQVVIELGDEWSESRAQDLADEMKCHRIPVSEVQGSDRVRIEGSPKRFCVGL